MDNLAWACFYCNNGKGSDLSSIDETTRSIVPLFDPRAQRWEEHFQLQDIQITGLTPTGRATVGLFEMNSANQMEIRERLIRSGEW